MNQLGKLWKGRKRVTGDAHSAEEAQDDRRSLWAGPILTEIPHPCLMAWQKNTMLLRRLLHYQAEVTHIQWHLKTSDFFRTQKSDLSHFHMWSDTYLIKLAMRHEWDAHVTVVVIIQWLYSVEGWENCWFIHLILVESIQAKLNLGTYRNLVLFETLAQETDVRMWHFMAVMHSH